MIKFLVFADGDKKPLKKFKHESEAFSFVKDIRNLQRYGCLSVERITDDDRCTWNRESAVWESVRS